MAHDDPFAGKTVHAAWGFYLDTADTYTPSLTATATNPNLGDTGTATGWWQRNGHFISGGAIFQFSGSGVSGGTGLYQISLPFDADASAMIINTAFGQASVLGAALLRDNSTSANSTTGICFLRTSTVIGIALDGGLGVDADDPFIWAAGDAISVDFAYLADPAGLPS